VEMKSEILRFIKMHLLSWIPEWNKRMQIHSNTLCFKGIGTLILACSEDIYSILSIESESSFTFSIRDLKN
jgi:hypothetical protein